MEKPPSPQIPEAELKERQLRCGACRHVWETNHLICPQCNGVGEKVILESPEGKK